MTSPERAAAPAPADDGLRPTKRALRHLFSRHSGIKVTDITYGDPDEVQVTFKLKAGWTWSDFL